MAPRIDERTVSIAGIETFIRTVGGSGTVTLLVHGNPTHSGEWVPFLHALHGPVIALDLPNFGRSERVAADRFAADLHAYAGFVGAAIDELGLERFNLVVNDWGGVALHPAQRRAERLERLVVINAVPLMAGYRWHWIARIWRRRALGELFNAVARRPSFALLLRQARPGFAAMPPTFVDMVWDCWDAGTADAVLRLYRSADPGVLEAAGARLQCLECPALVIWGVDDPYLGPEVGRSYAARLPGAELIELERAGHWPWIDRPEVVGLVADFLSR